MRLAFKGIIPPKEWEHNSALTDSSAWTVAMFIAYYCL